MNTGERHTIPEGDPEIDAFWREREWPVRMMCTVLAMLAEERERTQWIPFDDITGWW